MEQQYRTEAVPEAMANSFLPCKNNGDFVGPDASSATQFSGTKSSNVTLSAGNNDESYCFVLVVWDTGNVIAGVKGRSHGAEDLRLFFGSLPCDLLCIDNGSWASQGTKICFSFIHQCLNKISLLVP